MRVLIVSQYFWPESFRINDLVRDLVAENVDVDVLTGQPNYPKGATFPGYRASGRSSQPWEGATLHRIPLAPRGCASALRLIWNYLSFVLSGLFLGPRALRGKPVDIIFVYAISPILQAIPAIFLKWLKGAKLVIWVQDLWPESLEATGFIRNKFALRLVHVLVRWIYARADLILVQSEAFVEPVAALADRRKVKYYPNSADAVFADGGCGGVLAVPEAAREFSVVFAGNLGSAQALDTIIDAAELLREQPGIHFVLVGSGSRSAWLAQQIEQRQLRNVSLPGQQPIEAMPPILGAANALLVSLNDDPIFYHTVPSKLQAYLAVGRPIIASLNGEGARIVKEAGAGIGCRAEDAQALAQAVQTLYGMTPEERTQLGMNGRRYFEAHFDSKHLTGALIEIFHELNPSAARAKRAPLNVENSSV